MCCSAGTSRSQQALQAPYRSSLPSRGTRIKGVARLPYHAHYSNYLATSASNPWPVSRSTRTTSALSVSLDVCSSRHTLCRLINVVLYDTAAVWWWPLAWQVRVLVGGAARVPQPPQPPHASQSFIINQMAQHLDSRRVLTPNGPNQNTRVCGLAPTAPTKTRLESRFRNKEV